MADHVATVQGIYEAFGRGDIPAILNRLAADVEWDVDAVDHGIPWLAPRRGPAEVAKFFETLAIIEFHDFQVLNLLAGGNQVAAVVHLDATVRATGKRLSVPEMHLWTFDEAGQVSRYRHYVDTRLLLSALS